MSRIGSRVYLFGEEDWRMEGIENRGLGFERQCTLTAVFARAPKVLNAHGVFGN